MLVTTARKQEHLESKARHVAQELGLPFVRRRSYSIRALCHIHQADHIVLITTEGMKCVFCDGEQQPFFFHPNSAMLRIRRLLRGEEDPLGKAAGLEEGMSVLDCTLGLGSDAIVASYLVGEKGRVVGVESVPVLAYIVQDGLRTRETEQKAVNEAMRRIAVFCDHHLSFLKQCANNQFDVVYFDPMFEQTVHRSMGIAPLKRLANYEELQRSAIEEAKRVAKKRIVLKDSRESPRFEALGFKPIVRPHASHWFGIIELEAGYDG
ncbi:16S rRNA G966 N2-methylase RsmD [Caldalkalibacillus uzonensis]|uniref:16S rRNA G966 N2-methylase RsmD n=1 Tax=Caldalkalibacillus uzonensis TaxID=353224 RepID=A0ABU0CQR3_9BACI|nr:class I SAM-dependent methyltransferase [Caldalkalibacillus uzonensis]MDQ0337352.1 16S rRNA G966 N2-methylase RsmD [Caldalkalibacillus uzonensis]